MRFISSELSYNSSVLTNLYDVLPSQIDKNQYLLLQKSIFLINLSYIFDEIPKLYDFSIFSPQNKAYNLHIYIHLGRNNLKATATVPIPFP